MRGNLDTRLRKLDEGGYDAIVLAAAGLKRLGLASRIRQHFDVATMIPCAGQGALGIEVHGRSAELGQRLGALADMPTWLAVEAERAVSRALGGSCSMPLAAHAVWTVDGTLALDAALGHASEPQAPLLRRHDEAVVADAAAARGLGERVAQALREAGAGGYLPAPDA